MAKPYKTPGFGFPDTSYEEIGYQGYHPFTDYAEKTYIGGKSFANLASSKLSQVERTITEIIEDFNRLAKIEYHPVSYEPGLGQISPWETPLEVANKEMKLLNIGELNAIYYYVCELNKDKWNDKEIAKKKEEDPNFFVDPVEAVQFQKDCALIRYAIEDINTANKYVQDAHDNIAVVLKRHPKRIIDGKEVKLESDSMLGIDKKKFSQLTVNMINYGYEHI